MPTALITGSAKRIGFEIAFFLAKKGFNIAMHYNKSGDMAQKQALEVVKQCGVKCKAFECNLANPEAIKSFFQSIQIEFGTIDALINNASVFEESTIGNITLEHLKHNFAVHLFSPILLSQAFAEQKNLQDGLIINILDKNIARTKTKYFAYLQSKKALWELTKYLAITLAPNIRTNAISPGFILPEEHSKADEFYMKHKLSSIPLQKQGSVDNILQGVEYILTNTYVNGQNLFIDGGSFLFHD